jgi:hypothetical protein
MSNAHSRHTATFFGFQGLAQVTQGERFEQKPIKSKELLTLDLGRAHGQKERFRSFQGTDLLCQLPAGDSGHLQIYQQYIGAPTSIGCKQLQGGSGIVGAKHLMALVSEQQSHQFKAHGIVVHQQNLVPGLDSSRPG